MKYQLRCALFGSFLGLFISSSVWADEVTDIVSEAMESYKKGEYKKASDDLSYALEMINQKKGKNLTTYLPEPLAGWTADEAQAQTAGAAMFGGGTVIDRSYHKGDASITIEMIVDSPMLQGVAMMLSNPALATSDGGELTRINKERAVIKYQGSEQSGELTMIVDNRIMISVKGNGIAKTDLTAYASAIDIAKLKDMQ